MSDNAHTEDQEMIERLGRMLREIDPVPGDVNDFARAAFSWRDIDGELAEIEYDSSTEDALSGVRSTATARMLTFEAGRWTIDIEYHEPTQRLIGQVSPGQRCTVELHYAGGAIGVYTDNQGRFDFDGVLPGPVSLVIRTPGNLQVIKTEWTVL